jgi:hypothetical protein
MDTEHNDARQAEAPVTEPESTNLIVFGLDEAQKPHASWFEKADAPLAAKAAGLMGMKVLRLTDDEQRGLAGKLPKGRVFESGKAFVPFVNKALYSQLAAMGGEEPSVDLAVVQAASEDEQAGEGSAHTKPADAVSSPVASSWASITVGSVVLVTEGRPQEGWWEAVVTEVKAGDLLVLRWRDFDEESPLVRKRQQVALLYPTKA